MKPLGMNRPVTVYFLSDEDFAREAVMHEIDPNRPAFAAWDTAGKLNEIYMKAEGIQHFAHELRHLQERRDFHTDTE